MNRQDRSNTTRSSKKQGAGSLVDNKTLIISGALVVVLAGVLGFVILKEPEPVRKPKPLPAPMVVPGSVRKSVRQDVTGQAAKSKISENLESEILQESPKSQLADGEKNKRPKRLEGTVQALREDLLDVAPGVYTGVRLAMGNEQTGAVDDEVKIDQLLKRLNVNYVEITASADSWDNLNSDAKVDLLYGTFSLLKKQYPELSQYVRVVFDDGRQALDLRFDDFRDVIETG